MCNNHEGQTAGCEAEMLFWGVTDALHSGQSAQDRVMSAERPSVRITYMSKGFSKLFPNRNTFNRKNGFVCVFEICI